MDAEHQGGVGVHGVAGETGQPVGQRWCVGQQVGSSVLLSIPPHQGYGSRGMPQAGIKGTDTLVFVVDVVGVR